jgi:hypothetical protein
MKYILFCLFCLVFAFAISGCKKPSKSLTSIDYYIVNTFEDSTKLNFQYKIYNTNNNMMRPDSHKTALHLSGKERRFISTGTIDASGNLTSNNIYWDDYSSYYIVAYALRSNGDTIRPSKNIGTTGYYNYNYNYNYSYNSSSLTAPVYWKKEVNPDTGKGTYTLELR